MAVLHTSRADSDVMVYVNFEQWLNGGAMPVKGTKKWTRFVLDAPGAREVYLCGSFNDWELTSIPMKRDRNGRWTARLLLHPGLYEYRMRVDGEWADDPTAERVPNPFGTTNCWREV